MNARLLASVLALALVAAWYRHSHQVAGAPRPADGVLVGAEPLWGAASIGDHASYIPLGHNESFPTGALDITGRVLALKEYPHQGLGEYTTLDLVLGWGPMSDNRVIDQLAIRQEDRHFVIEPKPALDLPLETAYRSSINISLSTDFAEHRQMLGAIRVGDVIRLEGWTVRIRNAAGATWEGVIGRDLHGPRSAVLSVHRLQVNDEKKFGNWDVELDYFPPQ
jgi:hypothetical protein